MFIRWGGGKGVIARRDNVNFKDEKFRDALFGEYGKFLTSLRGAYLGAEDVGLTPADTSKYLFHINGFLERMFHHARFVTCIPQEIGGKQTTLSNNYRFWKSFKFNRKRCCLCNEWST